MVSTLCFPLHIVTCKVLHPLEAAYAIYVGDRIVGSVDDLALFEHEMHDPTSPTKEIPFIGDISFHSKYSCDITKSSAITSILMSSRFYSTKFLPYHVDSYMPSIFYAYLSLKLESYAIDLIDSDRVCAYFHFAQLPSLLDSKHQDKEPIKNNQYVSYGKWIVKRLKSSKVVNVIIQPEIPFIKKDPSSKTQSTPMSIIPCLFSIFEEGELDKEIVPEHSSPILTRKSEESHPFSTICLISEGGYSFVDFRDVSSLDDVRSSIVYKSKKRSQLSIKK
ncbi:hypothetical protein ADUPG1_008915 [Aduncisulcus paluster]|uniref:Uncharacterized protein n=1 Tax=Aduncisulcus paluster TaxID=2918883 RepID=A0ABQ5KTQ4_9EUKA|nr:hypothetical protein ADUPG1_008915 [Aduncisulcus paluster]